MKFSMYSQCISKTFTKTLKYLQYIIHSFDIENAEDYSSGPVKNNDEKQSEILISKTADIEEKKESVEKDVGSVNNLSDLDKNKDHKNESKEKEIHFESYVDGIYYFTFILKYGVM